MSLQLPLCQWRGERTADGRFACSCPKLIVCRAGVRAETCAACPYADSPPAARPLPDAAGCRHLGERTGRTVLCEACGNRRVRLFVFLCQHPAKERTTLAECKTCPFWET